MGNVIFVVIFVIFCAFLLGAGLISKRWVKESSDFVLAGREISTPINVVGVIAIGFAGTTVTLAPGFTIQYGLLGGLGWGVIYSVCGLLIFGLLYANFVRRSGAQTLPEFLEMRYDGHTRSVVAITSVIGMCGIMANNVVSSVDNIAAFTGWNRLAITAIIFAVIIVFTFVSGLWATTITDLFQVLIGVIVVPATFFILAGRFGWLDAISANWGAGDFMSQGFVGALPGMKLTYPSVFNFIICFAVALVWGNNYYWMKVANCRSEKVARRSFVAAAIILIVVFMVPLCFIGGYMGAFYPEQLTLNGGTVAPTGTYGYVAKTFVSLFGSLVVISAVAASISTASTSALGASAVANRDIYQRLINPKADAKKSLKMSKIIMLLIGVVTFVLCQFPGGPTYLFAFANCWLVPPAILLGLGAIWPRFNGRGALWGAVCGMATMAVFTLLDLTKGYAAHEATTLIETIKSRRSVITATSTPQDVLKQEGVISEALGRISMVAERYPELKANENYAKCMNAVDSYEKMVRTSRLIYNDSVTKLNREIRMFPVSLLAAPFGFHARDYLEAVEEKADMPSMQ